MKVLSLCILMCMKAESESLYLNVYEGSESLYLNVYEGSESL